MALGKPSVQAFHVIKMIATKRSDLGIIIYIVQTYDTVRFLSRALDCIDVSYHV